jgi:hypothetical protein
MYFIIDLLIVDLEAFIHGFLAARVGGRRSSAQPRPRRGRPQSLPRPARCRSSRTA